jgi:hypothetical protein
LHYALQAKRFPAGTILGLGTLTKWFPLLVLPAIWKNLGGKQALRIVISAVLLILLVWGALYVLSPTLTKASLISQGAKGSWESIWAILDGNFQTGNFNPAANRADSTTATLPAGNPPLLSPWVTLVFFAGLGLFLFWKAEVRTTAQLLAFSGLTILIFLFWSPGYSPQWVLFILPFAILSFDFPRSVLVTLTVLLINLLEWPVLLSRGLFQFLPSLIVLRTTIYIFVAILFVGVLFNGNSSQSERDR